MQRCLAASLFWASCSRPIDLLLTYGGELRTTARRPDFHFRGGHWGMLSLLQALSKDEAARGVAIEEYVRTYAPPYAAVFQDQE